MKINNLAGRSSLSTRSFIVKIPQLRLKQGLYELVSLNTTTTIIHTHGLKFGCMVDGMLVNEMFKPTGRKMDHPLSTVEEQLARRRRPNTQRAPLRTGSVLYTEIPMEISFVIIVQ